MHGCKMANQWGVRNKRPNPGQHLFSSAQNVSIEKGFSLGPVQFKTTVWILLNGPILHNTLARLDVWESSFKVSVFCTTECIQFKTVFMYWSSVILHVRHVICIYKYNQAMKLRINIILIMIIVIIFIIIINNNCIFSPVFEKHTVVPTCNIITTSNARSLKSFKKDSMR